MSKRSSSATITVALVRSWTSPDVKQNFYILAWPSHYQDTTFKMYHAPYVKPMSWWCIYSQTSNQVWKIFAFTSQQFFCVILLHNILANNKKNSYSWEITNTTLLNYKTDWTWLAKRNAPLAIIQTLYSGSCTSRC